MCDTFYQLLLLPVLLFFCNISMLFMLSLVLVMSECFDGFSESNIHRSAVSSSQFTSTQHCLIEQPNIDLQVTLTQRWPGLNALMIDVAPYCLLTNECDLELTLVEENGGCWRLPAGKTFSPPFFNEVHFFSFLDNIYIIMLACS